MRLSTLAFFMVLSLPTSIWAGSVESLGKAGQVDWIKGVVSVKAQGVRKAGAIAIGPERYKALYESVLELRVSDGIRVKDLVQVDSELRSKLLKIVRSAKMVNIRYLSDSSIELSLEVRLWGKGGIAEALLSSGIETRIPTWESPEMDRLRALERRIEAIEELLRSLGYRIKPMEEPTPEYTGVILDLRDTGFRPSIFPRIICEGESLYSLNAVNWDILVEKGMVLYTDSLILERIRDRVGENPLIISVRRLSPDKTDPIIGTGLRVFKGESLQDAIRRCRIAMIIDTNK